MKIGSGSKPNCSEEVMYDAICFPPAGVPYVELLVREVDMQITQGQQAGRISDIDALVQSYRAAGMDLGLEVTGDPGPVSLPAGLGLYRILQESLTNAAKHAPGHRTEISLSYESNSAWLKVFS